MKKLLMIAPFILSVLFFACDDDKGNPIIPDDTTTSTWIEDGGYWSSLVDAESETSFVYFSFATQETVAVTDAQAPTSSAWDIAFKRYHVQLNGGLSGNKGVVGVDLAVAGSPDSTDFAAVVDTSDITISDWMEDNYSLSLDEWYSYNPISHAVDPTYYVYLLKDAAGKYVKFQVIDIFDGGQPPDMGSVKLRYVYQADGPDVSGVPDTLTLIVGVGTGYVDFSTGMEVTPADPENSTDWDMAFTQYEIHLNSSLWGRGYASAYPAYQDSSLTGGNPTNFDGITTAVTNNTGYFTDVISSALTDWWYHMFDGTQSRLPSRDHVYLIKVDDSVYKLKIHSYYHPDTETAAANITFHWAELE